MFVSCVLMSSCLIIVYLFCWHVLPVWWVVCVLYCSVPCVVVLICACFCVNGRGSYRWCSCSPLFLTAGPLWLTSASTSTPPRFRLSPRMFRFGVALNQTNECMAQTGLLNTHQIRADPHGKEKRSSSEVCGRAGGISGGGDRGGTGAGRPDTANGCRAKVHPQR